MAKRRKQHNKSVAKPAPVELDRERILVLISHVFNNFEESGTELRYLNYRSIGASRTITFYDKVDDQEMFSILFEHDGISFSSGKTPVNFMGRAFTNALRFLAENCYKVQE